VGLAALPGTDWVGRMRHTARFLDRERPSRDRRLATAARAAAARVLRSPSNRRAIEALPLRPGARVVGFGDSLTADALSWFEILRHALGEMAFVNLGVSGDTTVHLVSRFAEVACHDPDLLLVMAGTNDARRHGVAATKMLVPDRETRCNLTVLQALVREQTRAQVVFVTPPPILERRVRRAPLLVREGVSWLAADVARKAALVSSLRAHVIDSRVALASPLDRVLLADGLHLSVRGQERLAGWILRSVAMAGLVGSRR
jgi:lysophospholipase L1-like esterase